MQNNPLNLCHISLETMSYLICVQFPSSGGTCSMLLFCKSNVANMGKFLNPAASIVVNLLLSANIISNFFISYNEEGKVVNLSNKCSVLYFEEELLLVRIKISSRMQVQVNILCPCNSTEQEKTKLPITGENYFSHILKRFHVSG